MTVDDEGSATCATIVDDEGSATCAMIVDDDTAVGEEDKSAVPRASAVTGEDVAKGDVTPVNEEGAADGETVVPMTVAATVENVWVVIEEEEELVPKPEEPVPELEGTGTDEEKDPDEDSSEEDDKRGGNATNENSDMATVSMPSEGVIAMIAVEPEIKTESVSFEKIKSN